MTSCFINYRTGDGEHVALLLGRELAQRFGAEEVFRASDSIPAGSDFEQELRKAVRGCEVLVAVIGSEWLEIRGGDGRRAVDNPEDWTRWEIAAAFASGATVIPVLIEATPRLRKDDLPKELAPLASCQYRRLRHRTSSSDLDEIAEAVLVAATELDRRLQARSGKETAVRNGEARTDNSMADVDGIAVQARDYSNSGVVVNGNGATTNTGSGDLNQNSTVTHVSGDQSSTTYHVAGDQNSTTNHVSGDQTVRGQNTGGTYGKGRR
ncbi:toll/interleukin-1 receptor domain-containing protein [Nocardiopsis ganjiahuensis]|uniref:toll/interleukin-1 receptor domain-containing protein n=1 Tax=Nocardiopsis ganjiahuensis TaxID=239984 RepID=UPI00034C724E|nr:toll/interleukin-1 receptor domain-containing protein [Nocardiopsis ganjiahuensis]